ncbi:DSBA-like thioredoxin domain containing protein [Aureococcus anophagefferens]|nr:DSBA-like thioredoxin domain containing protein [Aureococcus anophagefferens]
MALVLALGRATAGAAPALYACAALQLGLLGAFLAACAAAGAAPEPYWAPPCVGSGATCIAGAFALGPKHWLILSSWILACAGALLLAPAATLRVARDDAVANDATAFILQAPFSMPGLAFGAMRRAGGAVFGGRADAALGHALFAASTVGLAVAVLAAWRRRAIFDHFEPKWAALTFPFCLSALCALGYSKGGGLALRIYALALAAAAAALVVCVAAGDARLLVGALRERRRGNESGKGTESGEDYKAYNRRRWGGDGWTRSLRAKGRAVGAPFANWQTWPHTMRAHQLMMFAPHEKEHELKERLFEAVYERGENISDLETLCRIAGDAGLDTAGFRAVADTRRRAARSRAQAARRPGRAFFIVHGAEDKQPIGFSGAVDPDEFEKILHQVL